MEGGEYIHTRKGETIACLQSWDSDDVRNSAGGQAVNLQ